MSSTPERAAGPSSATSPVTRIDDADMEEKLDDQPKSLLLHMMGQLRIGMDLSKITLPTFVLEPRSLLEKLTDCLAHADIIAG